MDNGVFLSSGFHTEEVETPRGKEEAHIEFPILLPKPLTET
jgi:hypothetical protein